MKSTVPLSHLFFLVFLLIAKNGAIEVPPFCSICDCKKDYSGYYKINCTTDIKINLFDNNFWFDQNDKEYPYKSFIIENTQIYHFDRQFPQSNLRFLSLKHCFIDYITGSAFTNLLDIEKLVLSHNNIERLHPETFVGPYKENGFSGLVQLLLDHNRIQTLSRDIFKHNHIIEILSLAHNPLESIDFQTNKALSGLHLLKKLDLSHTRLSSLPANFLKHVEELRYLDLSGNQFVTVPESLPNVKNLQFGGNPLVTLSNFPNVTSLRNLYMCNMPFLQEIKEGSFSNLTHLDELHLCDNTQLRKINRNAFLRKNGHRISWTQVTKFYLQNNDLNTVDMGLLAWDDLEDLDLSNNSWNCDCDNRWMLEDLFPNVLLKLNPTKAELLTCTTPNSLASLHFGDVFENDKMETCWIFHKTLRHWLYNIIRRTSATACLISLLILVIPCCIFWYRFKS